MKDSIEEQVRELTEGQGYLMLRDFFSPDQVAEARDLLYRFAEEEPERTSHFHGDESMNTQKRVWNLPGKGRVFQEMVSDRRLLEMMRPILGEDLMLSSWAANITYPGASAQEAHVDYPYWDLHKRENWPRTLNASFHLAVEVILMLDDFTVENGATAFMPGSQKRCAWPDEEEFDQKSLRAIGSAGTVMIFPALLWHAAQANQSQASRAALLASYTNKNIKPIEDWSRCISRESMEACPEAMQKLLGYGYAYPAVMDGLPARSSEGTRSQKNITEEV